MPRYTKNINAIYISERMQENLRYIKEHVITTIIAQWVTVKVRRHFGFWTSGKKRAIRFSASIYTRRM